MPEEYGRTPSKETLNASLQAPLATTLHLDVFDETSASGRFLLLETQLQRLYANQKPIGRLLDDSISLTKSLYGKLEQTYVMSSLVVSQDLLYYLPS